MPDLLKKDCPACDGFGYTVPVSGGESCPTCGYTTPTDVEQVCSVCNGDGHKRPVVMVASAYDWTCLNCFYVNQEIEITLSVTCERCGVEFETGKASHNYG